jgi:hypothetical protein
MELNVKERRLLRSLDRPWKIQRWLDSIPINFELNGETCMSPRRVMREKRAHCIEGAFFAALALRVHGYEPLVVDIDAAASDDAHVMAVYRIDGHWGAIHKSNHLILRYREPVYRTIRELVMSHFHEYTNADGKKTMRSYTRPINLKRFDARGWATDDADLWDVASYLADAPHIPVVDRSQIARLRPLGRFESTMLDVTEWDEVGRRSRSLPKR